MNVVATNVKIKWENSWYLKTGMIHHFICKCGQHDTLIKLPSLVYHPHYKCSSCANSHYLDSVMFVYDKDVMFWSSFYWGYETYKDTNGWHIHAVSRIPFFDFSTQKIIIKKVSILSKSLSFNGEIKDKVYLPAITKKYVYQSTNVLETISQHIRNNIGQYLLDFILANRNETLKWLNENDIFSFAPKDGLNALEFFLNHTSLRQFDFFYWKNIEICSDQISSSPTVEEMLMYIFNKRNEKSIKKAYFKSYSDAIIKGEYNPIADYIFARTIKDRNFLQELILLDIGVKNVLFEETDLRTVILFCTFLSEYYSERSIVRIWKSVGIYEISHHILRDTIRMFARENVRECIKDNFNKPKATLNKIHDEFVKLNNLYLQAVDRPLEYDYLYYQKEAAVKYDDMHFCLPVNIYQLQKWASKLRNCMSSYHNEIYSGRSIIYGVFKYYKIYYAIEIKNNIIIQAKGVGNSTINDEDYQQIDNWFKKIYLSALLKGDKV